MSQRSVVETLHEIITCTLEDSKYTASLNSRADIHIFKHLLVNTMSVRGGKCQIVLILTTDNTREFGQQLGILTNSLVNL